MTEQFRDKLNEISDNNAVIAENQQSVYNAGIKAGKAQDVDYADGYADGHSDGYAEGIGAASGGAFDDIISGATPVGRATIADRATTADYAILAARSTDADHADVASHADNATRADAATNANHAETASHSETAGHATEADRAENAGHATSATTATTANSAGHADDADYAAVAGRASAVYAKGTVTSVAVTVTNYNYTVYNISIALGISPKVLFLAHNTRAEMVICTNGRYIYTGAGDAAYVISGSTTFSDGTLELTFPLGEGPFGFGSGSWSYVAIM